MKKIQEQTELTRAQERFDNADQELGRLMEIADDAEAEAGRLSKAFEMDPDDASFTKKAVAAQRSKNARDAVESYLSGEIASAKAALEAAKREAIEAKLRTLEQAFTERFNGAMSTIATALGEMDQAFRDLEPLDEARKKAKQEGVDFDFKLSDLVAQQAKKFSNFNPAGHTLGQWPADTTSRFRMALTHVGSGDFYLKGEFRMPVSTTARVAARGPVAEESASA